ncbi:MAG TPA: AAA family ATPase [Tepidisphaeraceae bacterium]|jgi:predicted ATPase|nr:AAA family ATPase [Tepidisphaeraceae bacterium]
MIQHIVIRNFKSVGEVSVDLSPVTVLIGRSGVGKSNFLRAIRFLRNFLLLGDTAINLEGGWARIWPFGKTAPLSFSARFTIPGFSGSFTYDVSWQSYQVRNQSGMHVDAERLLLGDTVIFDRNGQNWARWPGEGPAPQGGGRIFLNSFPTISEVVLAYTVWTSGIGWHDFPATVFNPSPPSGGSVLGNPSDRASQNIGMIGGTTGKLSGLDDGASNYLDVIRDITQDLRDQRARRQILARVKQINPIIDSLELDSIIQPRRVVVAHNVGGLRIGLDLSQESDGFRRYYAHLLALYQTPPKQVLMFEEPENGIYPGALRNLAEEFRAAPSSGRGQVLLTTQSPDLLDGFTPDQLRVVELDENQLTKVSPLDPAQSEALRAKLLEPGELLTVDSPRAAQTSA